ncbi:MAG: S8 family serine peptidase [Verrucomicrobia bacterium]|nr:S8 family serine peptidase [Verrucomicrobiota bacterium]
MNAYLSHGAAALAGVILLGIASGNSPAATSARVWVQFSPGQKAAVRAQLEAARGQIHYEFDNLDAIAVTLPEPALAGIARNPNVLLVEEDPARYLHAEQTPYGVTTVDAPTVWDLGSSGGGVTVGVIDTGVYAAHEDLEGQAVSGEASATTGDWDFDGAGHGTHVVGTILAADNDVGVIGVAPEASVYMVKVFDDTGAWAYSSTLVYAVGQAINQGGAKIISMSLGGGRKSMIEQRAFDSYYRGGALLVAAAGNAGTSALNYPASYPSVISVAAIDPSQAWATFSQYNSQVELAAPGVAVLSTVPYAEEVSVAVDSVSYAGFHIENAARGTATGGLVDGGLGSGTDSSWSGKVVLIQRGDISFYDKVMNVQNSGGIAAVIYNNEPGGFLGTLGDGFSSLIPAISISQEDGSALLGEVGGFATVTSLLKAPASGYAYYDGTSMATPHVSGVAALLWGAFPAKSNADIRAALQQTAMDLGTAGRDPYYGFGLVQAGAAYTFLDGSGGGDTEPPVISNVSATRVNVRKFKITWTTDEPATSTVAFSAGLTRTYADTAFVTAHSMSFTGKAGTTYEFTVGSADAAGNPAASGPYTYTH